MQAADKETDLYVNVQVATKQQRNQAAAYPHASDLLVNQQVATKLSTYFMFKMKIWNSWIYLNAVLFILSMSIYCKSVYWCI